MGLEGICADFLPGGFSSDLEICTDGAGGGRVPSWHRGRGNSSRTGHKILESPVPFAEGKKLFKVCKIFFNQNVFKHTVKQTDEF